MFDQTLYQAVIDQARVIRTLETILGLLTWDQETIMPKAANDHRTQQKTLLAGLIHERKTASTYFENITTLFASIGDDRDEAVVIKRLHRDITKARKLPTHFVQTLSKATSEAFDAWQQAKQQNQWRLFEPHLERIVQLMQEKAHYLGYQQHPLDPLLDEHEPESTTHDIATLFSSLKPKLLKVLHEVQRTPSYGQRRKILCPFEDQMAISKALVTLIGFDWNRGRLDTSEHPFSIGIHPTDTRITIRHSSKDLLDQMMSALHEAGHGLYEMALPRQHFGTPLAEAASLSIHESQSRLWETVIGRSRSFCTHLYSIMTQHVKGTPVFTSPEELYQALNRVECACVRTQADEMTYPFHVIIRFEIEQELMKGILCVKDLPERWNSAMKEMLGITPSNDTEGCLQDVHWALGSFGYFPTYFLGSLYAICWYKAMENSILSLEKLLSKGVFAPIHEWLYEHVWQHGRRFLSAELVTKALGRRPSEDDYIEYLRSKYVG